MRITFLLILCTTYLSSLAQTMGPENKLTPGFSHLSGQIIGAENQKISFGNQNLGGVTQALITVDTDAEGKFSLDYDLPFKDYYFLKFENNQMLNVILHGNDSIKIYGDVRNIQELSNFVGSEESEAMNQFVVALTSFKKVEDSLKMAVRANPQSGPQIDAYFKPIAEDFYQKRNNYINKFANSAALVVAINVVDPENEWTLYTQLADLLGQSFGESPTIKNVLAYVDNLKAEKEAKAFLEPGRDAKEIVMPNPEGEVIKLSDLKGKVVLIDFWASWCRPCRMENPNVVNMYEKYNKDGFEVYSVSLDSDKTSWMRAIEQDKLVWPSHVSDLKKWECAAAKDYAVKGIPFTVLIDQEGKIIGTNFRGAALENQLKTIFGH